MLKKILPYLLFVPLVVSSLLLGSEPSKNPVVNFFIEHGSVVITVYCLVWVFMSLRKFPKMDYVAVAWAVLVAFLTTVIEIRDGVILKSSVDQTLKLSSTFILMANGASSALENIGK